MHAYTDPRRMVLAYLVSAEGLGLAGNKGLGHVGVDLLLLELLLELLLVPPPSSVAQPTVSLYRRGEMVNGQGLGLGDEMVTDLDVDTLLGVLLLAEHAALAAVAEEVPAVATNRSPSSCGAVCSPRQADLRSSIAGTRPARCSGGQEGRL
ncbi:unnamed protein product [Urochloa humidicola]